MVAKTEGAGRAGRRPRGASTGPTLFRGDSDVRKLMRRCDWAATPLGSPEGWPSSLQAIVRAMLTSRFAMWMAWGPELTFLCNDAYLPTVGIKRDWVIGSRSDKVWAEIWPDIGPRIEHVLTTGEATWDEALLLYLGRSGFREETYHTFSYSPLADDDGATAGMLCVVAEETERVIGERQLAALRDLGARLSAASARRNVMQAIEASIAEEPRDLPFALVYMIETEREAVRCAVSGLAEDDPLAPEHILLDDRQAPWPLSLAAAAPRLVDITPERLAGLPRALRQSPPGRALVTPIAGVEGGTPIGFFVAGLNPNRRLDTGYQGFITLLTAQISAALARTDEYDRARQRAEALTAIDRAKTAFFSNVSHEFRTPLTLMLGPLEDEIAEAAQRDEPAQGERLKIAHRNALRLLRLVNTLLDFSRIESGRARARYRPTDLAQVTADLAASFRSATDKAGLDLTVDTPPLSAPVFVDADMWDKIVLNLLSNAFKFTFAGGITVRLVEAEDAAVLTVADTGVGIPEAELTKLFDRFHRVEGTPGRSYEGSGIGLALVQDLVRLHGGEVSVESRQGAGSTFTVRQPLGAAHLPADQVDPAVPSPAAAPESPAAEAQAFVQEALRWLPGEGDPLMPGEPSPRAAGGAQAPSEGASAKQRVLLADDNADLRGYIARLLAEAGFEVAAAPDGEAALDALRERRPDLLITDVMMPRLDGFGLLKAVRESPELRDLPVIMLSARAGEEAKVEGLDAGADDYLVKPFSARELIARVAANIALARIRRETAQAVAAAEARAGRILAGMSEGYILLDRDFRVVEVNDEVLRVSRRKREEIIGRVHWDVWPGSENLPQGQAYQRALNERLSTRVEASYDWPDGRTAWYDINAHPVDDGVAVFIRNITARKQAEQDLLALNASLEARVEERTVELLRAEEALRQAQKMEAVGQLTGGIAHDFNNLLTVISGNVDIARRALAGGQSGRADRAMGHAEEGALRAQALTERLLAFSRRQPLAPRAVDANALLAGMSDLLRRALGETVRLDVVSGADLWLAEADANQLEIAILNLAVNGRDAMTGGGNEGGGALTIETANARLDADQPPEDVEMTPGDYVMIAVTDSGAGMSAEVLERVFEPFFTTKEVGKGTGLGLSMVYGFVKQSGGHVSLSSEPGKGTTVRIWLPRHENIGATAEERPGPKSGSEGESGDAPGKARSRENVLVVEDDPHVRAYTVEVLRELGYGVFEAADGPSALSLLERRQDEIALLFTDVVMPTFSGRELADRARELRPELKILYTSGYAHDAITHGGRLDPGVALIAKPFTFQALADKIAEVLG